MMDLSSQSSKGADFQPPPLFWGRLPLEEKTEFIKLRNQLHSNQKQSAKDSRVITFQKELSTVLEFTERDDIYREERCILTGIAFAGSIICVNTRLLKSFLGRCKSSINSGFQQMGYVAIKTKTKARICVVTVLKSLTNDPTLLRQWTVRGVSNNAESCFKSKFNIALLPEITPNDLNIDNHTPMTRSSSFMIQKNSQIVSKNSEKSPDSQSQENPWKTQISSSQINCMDSPFCSEKVCGDSFGNLDDIDMSMNWGFPQKNDYGISSYLDDPKLDRYLAFSMTRSISSYNVDDDFGLL